MHNSRFITRLLGFVFCVLLAACAKDENVLEPDDSMVRQARVTLLATHNGLGDNGYIDSSVEGVFAFSFETGTPMQMLLPDSKEEAEQMYKQWIAENADKDSAVLVVGTEAYGDFVEHTPVRLTGKGTRVLIFESNITEQSDGISSIFINRYGAAYLCGAMSGMLNAFVIAATPGYATLEDAIHGFMDGFEAHHNEGRKAEFAYLAEGEDGFAMPDSAYHLLTKRMENFFFYTEMVFPLLGGSGVGILRSMNDNEDNVGLVIGMDVDQSAMSSRVPFSMIIKTGEVVYRYLDGWLKGQEWPKTRIIGMREGGSDVMVHPIFYQRIPITLGTYEDPNTFADLYKAYYDEAVRKEEEYYAQ